MAINETATGTNSVAIQGSATGENSAGVAGKGETNGVQAEGGGNGLFATGRGWCGVIGISDSTTGGFGVYGTNTAGGTGVAGVSKSWMGVYGSSASTVGGAGVMGEATGTGPGIYGKGSRAGYFEGDVEITGDLRLLNADCAEDFDIGLAEAVEPGTVMVIDDDGALVRSNGAYDKRVAGVVSGAGTYKPAIVLDKRSSERVRQPIALLGKVYCKVDAQGGAIEVGDLLTTSPTPGHAMKAGDPLKAFGAVIGKALHPLREGQGLIPILVALQ